MNHHSGSNWYRRLGDAHDAAPTVVWFPHAGGGASPLIRKVNQMPSDVRLFVATLPGREGRFREPIPETLDELVGLLVAEMPHSASPPVLIGHSFGGLLAYRVARLFPVAGLVVMAMSSPDRIQGHDTITHLEDPLFAERLDQRYGGVPKMLRENEEAMRLFLPTVRHDLRLLETYRQVENETIDAPILALAGSDDARVTPEAMQNWRDRTMDRFSMQTLPGDHFFPTARFEQIMRLAQSLAHPAA